MSADNTETVCDRTELDVTHCMMGRFVCLPVSIYMMSVIFIGVCL